MGLEEIHKNFNNVHLWVVEITGNFYLLLGTSLYFHMFTNKCIFLLYSESNDLLLLLTFTEPPTALAVGQTDSKLPIVTPFLGELALTSLPDWVSPRRNQSSSSLALDPRSMGSVPYFCVPPICTKNPRQAALLSWGRHPTPTHTVHKKKKSASAGLSWLSRVVSHGPQWSCPSRVKGGSHGLYRYPLVCHTVNHI